MKSECLKLAVMPINDTSEIKNNNPTKIEIETELNRTLIPTINSIHMIAQMMEQETLGPIELGPYKDYISALKQCAQEQDLFSKDLTTYLKTKA